MPGDASKKKPSAKRQGLQVKPPFPFIGAGEASYFEWATVSVCFERKPTRAEALAIREGVPALLQDSIEWAGPLLQVTSEQDAHRAIEAAYGKKTGTMRFNEELDAWLRAAHEKVPILVAYRAEDEEGGGTQLSAWHEQSLAALPCVIATLKRSGNRRTADLVRGLEEIAKTAKLRTGRRPARKAKPRARSVDADDDGDDVSVARGNDWRTVKAKASAALGEPAPRYTKVRNSAELAVALERLAQTLPATVKRLRKLAMNGLTVRPGATAEALAATEKALGTELSPEHRALLEAFDGGQIGDIVILGTAKGGATGDAEIVAFVRVQSSGNPEATVVAHTGRDDVITIPRDRPTPVLVLNSPLGAGWSTVTRKCKALDQALDLALKVGRVWTKWPGTPQP